MDEIDWLEIAKKVLLFCFEMYCFTAILIVVSILFSDYRNNWKDIKTVLLYLLIVGLILIAFIIIFYFVLFIFSKILNPSGRTVFSFDKEYIRDLPKHCSPAISSLIYDLKIDVYKDYTATILYLCIKKYINLVKDGDNYKLELTQQQDYSSLERCEKYVLDVLKNKIIFDENEFKKEIIKEAQEKNLITDQRYSITPKIVLLSIFIITSLIITFFMSKMICAILTYLFFFILYIMVEFQPYFNFVNTEYRRTEDGKKTALLLKGLKRYIKEYTLIKEKEIDSIQILENYIPYALSLDEADAIEKFLKYNEKYRNLIYNRKDMKEQKIRL